MPSVISVYDESTVAVQDWADVGYDCYCVDIIHPRGYTATDHPRITRIGTDARYWIPPQSLFPVAFVMCWPPCTNLAVSGARWFQEKGLRGLIEGLELVERAREICEAIGAPYLIENPVSTLSTYWRKPDYTFNPNEYAGYLPEGERE